jgi:hypothetical protein
VEVFAVTKALEISSTSMLTKQVNWIVGAGSANVIRWLGKVYIYSKGREGYRVSLVIIK